MLATDEDAFICDMAETYGVLNWRALDVRLAGTLAAGLRPFARIWEKINEKQGTGDTRGFNDAESFEKARNRILKAG